MQGSPSGTFEVTHEGQNLPVGRKVLLVFTAEEGSNSCVGEAVVTLQGEETCRKHVVFSEQMFPFVFLFCYILRLSEKKISLV